MEMESDRLAELDIAESILNATTIYKTVRSTSLSRRGTRERLYVIESTNLTGLSIYTKGKLVKKVGQEIYYFFISAKRSLKAQVRPMLKITTCPTCSSKKIKKV